MNFYIKTYGCQMNVSDSEKIRYLLERKGLKNCPEESEADIIIINSCAVREKAQEKIFSYIGRIPRTKKVIVAGCVAQAEKQDIMKRSLNVDFILGTHQFYRIHSVIEKMVRERDKDILAEFTREWEEICPDQYSRESQVTGFISIMEGCNNFCHYCIVPFTRGREKYRPFDRIIEEAEYLSEIGYQEIILLGQNVNNWEDGNRKMKFPALLRTLAEKINVRWIRFITSYPGYFDDELIEVMAQYSKIARHLHFPAQSGSTRILKRMNRRYTRGEYLKIISRFKVKIPQMKFSSDFIVGFPHESERDFQLTLSLIKKVEFESIFSFIYSPRKYTRSYQDKDEIGLKVMKERLFRLQGIQEEIQLKNNEKLVNSVTEVLVTQKNPRKIGEVIGRTESYRVVNFVTTAQPGEWRKVLVKKAGPHSLRGTDLGDSMSTKGYLDFA